MSRGHGRAERWLLSQLAGDPDGVYDVTVLAERYAEQHSTTTTAARPTLRRAAHRLADEGHAEIGYTQNHSERRGLIVGPPDAVNRWQARRKIYWNTVFSLACEGVSVEDAHRLADRRVSRA